MTQVCSPQIMEGGGGEGTIEPKVVGWMWGFVWGGGMIGGVVLILLVLGKLAANAQVNKYGPNCKKCRSIPLTDTLCGSGGRRRLDRAHAN